MKPFALATKREGEKFPDAWVSIGRTKDSNGSGSYVSACIPVPVFQQYEEFDSGLLCEGWRVIRAVVGIRRNSVGRWFVRGGGWMHSLSKRVICKREDMEDGLIHGDEAVKAKKAYGRF